MLNKPDAPVCLVFGVNGQDGSYLAERLLAEGCHVVGVGRQDVSRWLSHSCNNFTYHQCDLSNVNSVIEVINSFSPDYIYHAAAIHGSSGFNYEAVWYSAHAVNSLTTHAILEYCRVNVKSRFVYLSSSKVLNFSNGDFITEDTPRKSDCIYTITKNTSASLIEYYRKHHGINASIVYTFNHESSRRSGDFFIPKIVNILKKSLDNHNYSEGVSNLSFFCDWGCAEEYMDLVFDISHKAIGSDFVMATGVTLLGKDFVNQLFSRYGLSAENHVYEISPITHQEKNQQPWHASCEKLDKLISRKPSKSVYEVCDEILNYFGGGTK